MAISGRLRTPQEGEFVWIVCAEFVVLGDSWMDAVEQVRDLGFKDREPKFLKISSWSKCGKTSELREVKYSQEELALWDKRVGKKPGEIKAEIRADKIRRSIKKAKTRPKNRRKK